MFADFLNHSKNPRGSVLTDKAPEYGHVPPMSPNFARWGATSNLFRFDVSINADGLVGGQPDYNINRTGQPRLPITDSCESLIFRETFHSDEPPGTRPHRRSKYFSQKRSNRAPNSSTTMLVLYIAPRRIIREMAKSFFSARMPMIPECERRFRVRNKDEVMKGFPRVEFISITRFWRTVGNFLRSLPESAKQPRRVFFLLRALLSKVSRCVSGGFGTSTHTRSPANIEPQREWRLGRFEPRCGRVSSAFVELFSRSAMPETRQRCKDSGRDTMRLPHGSSSWNRPPRRTWGHRL